MVSAAFAIVERCPTVPSFDKYSFDQLCAEINRQSDELQVKKKLQTFSDAIEIATSLPKSSDYYLLVLRPAEQTVTISGFDRRNLEAATRQYLEEERRLVEAGSQVVLVRAGSLDALKKAYPNYFLDTRAFLRHLAALRDRGRKRELLERRLGVRRPRQLLLWPGPESIDDL